MKYCSALGSKIIKKTVEPGPILSEIEDQEIHLQRFDVNLPEMNVFGTSGIISIDAGGMPGCSARVTGPNVTSHVSKLPIFCGI